MCVLHSRSLYIQHLPSVYHHVCAAPLAATLKQTLVNSIPACALRPWQPHLTDLCTTSHHHSWLHWNLAWVLTRRKAIWRKFNYSVTCILAPEGHFWKVSVVQYTMTTSSLLTLKLSQVWAYPGSAVEALLLIWSSTCATPVQLLCNSGITAPYCLVVLSAAFYFRSRQNTAACLQMAEWPFVITKSITSFYSHRQFRPGGPWKPISLASPHNTDWMSLETQQLECPLHIWCKKLLIKYLLSN